MCKLNYVIVNESQGYATDVTRSLIEALRMRLDAAASGDRVVIIRVPDVIPELEAPEHYPDELKEIE